MTYKVFVDGLLFCDSEIDETALISPVVRLEENKAGSFEFTIPTDHMNQYRQDIRACSSLVSVHLYSGNTETILFVGAVVSTSENFAREIHVVCEGCLALLNRRYSFYNTRFSITSIRTFFGGLFRGTGAVGENFAGITAGDVTVTPVLGATEIDAGGIINDAAWLAKLPETFGGTFYIRPAIWSHSKGYKDHRMSYSFWLDYLSEPPKKCNQDIAAFNNLIDINVDIDETALFTVLKAIGENVGSVPAGWNNPLTITALKNQYGIIEKVVKFNNIIDQNLLTSLGTRYIQDNLYKSIKATAKFLDNHYIDDRFDLIMPGYDVRVRDTANLLDENMRVISRTFNLNNPENDTATLGAAKKYIYGGITT